MISDTLYTTRLLTCQSITAQKTRAYTLTKLSSKKKLIHKKVKEIKKVEKVKANNTIKT